jgi:MOSC domain-containing protein YiiM
MGRVVAVCRSRAHGISKPTEAEIHLLAGLGVEGDAHMGKTVQHLSRMKGDPTQPNLRQVHLIHAELYDELTERGMPVRPGEMGENVTTRGIDLLALPTGTILGLGDCARVEVTGLRNPCVQLDGLHEGLKGAVLDRDLSGRLVRRAGIMAVVLRSGRVRADDPVAVELPPPPHRGLEPV